MVLIGHRSTVKPMLAVHRKLSLSAARRSRGAFTLLELIVTIVILAILAALAIPTFAQVISKSKLEAAEVTLGSFSREVLALDAFSGTQVFNEDTVLQAAKDLPVQALAAGLQAGATEWNVVVDNTSFSTNANTLSVAIGGEPTGTLLGSAVYVPGAGCAYALAEGSSVQTWSVAGAPVTLCSGTVALGGPDAGLSAPGTPGGLTLGIGECATGEEGLVIDWEGAESAEIFLDGSSLGSFGPGTCFPGLNLDSNINVIKNQPLPELPPGEGPDEEDKGTTIGGVLSDSVISITWDKELAEGSVVTIIRNGETIQGPYGDGVFWDTPGEPGEHKYRVVITNNNGIAVDVPASVVIVKAPSPEKRPSSLAAANGNTIRVQWGAVENTVSAPLTGYKVFHSLNQFSNDWELIADIPTPVANTYFDHAKLSLGVHCYRVVAYGPGGESAPSEASCAVVKILPTPAGMALDAISSGAGHTCGIAQDSVYCWGSTSNNRLGTIPGINNVTRPLQMPTEGTDLDGRKVSAVSVAGGASCAIAGGEVVCWGSTQGAASKGRIPTLISSAVVPADEQSSFTSLDVNDNASCAIASGSVYCWGNSWTRGDGVNAPATAMAAVAKDAGALAGKTATEVGVSSSHACALADGSVYCWGENSSGQLGNGVNGITWKPTKVKDAPGVFTNANIVDISVGNNHTCAVDSAGQAYCWGASGYIGSVVSANAPLPVKVNTSGALAGEKIVSLESTPVNNPAGSTCAITESGKAICWNVTPALVNFPNPDAANSVQSISMGGATTCALTGDGAYCWGSNASGQFGNGTTTASTTPKPVNP